MTRSILSSRNCSTLHPWSHFCSHSISSRYTSSFRIHYCSWHSRAFHLGKSYKPPAIAHNLRLGVHRLSNFVSKIKFSKENQRLVTRPFDLWEGNVASAYFPANVTLNLPSCLLKQILVGCSNSNFVSLSPLFSITSEKKLVFFCVSHIATNSVLSVVLIRLATKTRILLAVSNTKKIKIHSVAFF
jgi:hypothetical protein